MSESNSSIRKPRRLPSLAALRAFEAAAAHASFQRAAHELSVTPTAVSHQVRMLEDALGKPLFVRMTRRVALTLEGEQLAAALREGFDAIEQGVRRLQAPRWANAVTLTANTAFIARWLLPRMGAFRSACPDIELRLHATEQLVDLASGDADIAVRAGAGDWPGLTSAPLLVDRYAPMCSPRYRLRRPSELKAPMLIHFDWQPGAHSPASWPRWFRAAGLADASGRDTRSGLSFSDESHAISATLAGHGVALLSVTLLATELETGALRQPFGPVLDTGRYYVAIARGREREPVLRRVQDWIALQAAATA
ncbi:LysR substrate-binding domain-containing protein [Pseudoxanthomonas putridarboris]|uniref:LysR substrate-binding domain-containing protein n=1 Tax=Pseudoxanthomonas putridarboris TaxID=752605 RepID=A0ABU9J314_9GAMM